MGKPCCKQGDKSDDKRHRATQRFTTTGKGGSHEAQRKEVGSGEPGREGDRKPTVDE